MYSLNIECAHSTYVHATKTMCVMTKVLTTALLHSFVFMYLSVYVVSGSLWRIFCRNGKTGFKGSQPGSGTLSVNTYVAPFYRNDPPRESRKSLTSLTRSWIVGAYRFWEREWLRRKELQIISFVIMCATAYSHTN